MKKSTLIALGVFALLIAAVFAVTRRSPERGIVRMALGEIKADEVTKIELSGKNTATLEKSGEDWLLVVKTDAGETKRKADAAAVKRAVEQLPKLTSSDLLTDSADKYAEYEVTTDGEDKKGTRVVAYAGSAVVADVVFGKAAGGGTAVLSDGKIFAVKGVYAGNFTKSGSAWLEKKLFADDIAQVARLEVSLAGQKPYALIEKDGAWALEDASVLPAGFRFDANAAKSLATQIVGLRAKDILDTDPGADKTKLDDPVVADVFRYTTKAATEGDPSTVKTHEVKFGAVDGGATFARVDGADLVTIYESTVKNLKKSPLDLRDLSMVKLDKDKVQKLSIVDGGKKLVLEKKGADWSITSASDLPKDFELDPAAVTRRLTQLTSTRALKVAPAGSAGQAGLGAATVTATTDDGKSVTLSFGKEIKDDSRDVVYAKGNIDGDVYLVAKHTRTSLAGLVDSFKKQPESAGPGGLGDIDPKALSNLPPDVRRSLEQQIQQKKQEAEMMKKLQAQMGQQQ